jgi:hypothetical protein
MTVARRANSTNDEALLRVLIVCFQRFLIVWPMSALGERLMPVVPSAAQTVSEAQQTGRSSVETLL